MEAVSLTAEEFRQIHNALCFARADNVDETVETIRGALANAYVQENSVFDAKMDYYREFQRDNDLAAIWSIYELPVHGFLSDHPYKGAVTMTYQGCHAVIKGPTWADLYRAADSVIDQSGDDHHIFIEGFLFAGDELRLTTGS